MRQAEIHMHGHLAGHLVQDERGYVFTYAPAYLATADAQPISLTLPLQAASYVARVLFPFFDGLIPEGWLLAVAERNWKLNARDRMGLLLACCAECIGAVSVHALPPDDSLDALPILPASAP